MAYNQNTTVDYAQEIEGMNEKEHSIATKMLSYASKKVDDYRKERNALLPGKNKMLRGQSALKIDSYATYLFSTEGGHGNDRLTEFKLSLMGDIMIPKGRNRIKKASKMLESMQPA